MSSASRICSHHWFAHITLHTFSHTVALLTPLLRKGSGIFEGGVLFVAQCGPVCMLCSADVCPTYWPERSYPWGTAQAFNPQHSDLLTLR